VGHRRVFHVDDGGVLGGVGDLEDVAAVDKEVKVAFAGERGDRAGSETPGVVEQGGGLIGEQDWGGCAEDVAGGAWLGAVWSGTGASLGG
jgi:hypothetical protein